MLTQQSINAKREISTFGSMHISYSTRMSNRQTFAFTISYFVWTVGSQLMALWTCVCAFECFLFDAPRSSFLRINTRYIYLDNTNVWLFAHKKMKTLKIRSEMKTAPNNSSNLLFIRVAYVNFETKASCSLFINIGFLASFKICGVCLLRSLSVHLRCNFYEAVTVSFSEPIIEI